VLFWLETAFFTLPAVMLWRGGLTTGCLFRQALFIVLGGALYRFDAYLVAFRPSSGWAYFPSVPETVMTVGLVALEVLLFIWLVRFFPILSGTSAAADHT
jgi:Ni/Fe-hydrogenase subunit HybB-like protein